MAYSDPKKNSEASRRWQAEGNMEKTGSQPRPLPPAPVPMPGPSQVPHVAPSGIITKQLLTDLDAAFLVNAGRVKTKRSCLRWAVGIISLGLVAASLMITLDTPTTITNHGQQEA